MEKKIINTHLAPAPIGPYKQAILAGNTLYISGQIPFDEATGKLLTEEITTAAKQVMENLKVILIEAGMTFENVVKSTIFLTDLSQFALVNEVYGSYFSADYAPARETVQVAGLPKGVHVEISMIACF